MKTKDLKIRRLAYITTDDPLDQRSWSGIYFRMFGALKSEFEEVIPFGPINAPMIVFLIKIYQFFSLYFFQRRYDRSHSVLLSRAYGYILKKKLQNKKIDAIFAPSGATLIAFLDTKIPIYYYSDATANLLIDYYFFNLSKLSRKELNRIESNALNKSKAAIFSSLWSAQDAISTYLADPNKVKIVKMGANIPPPSEKLNIIKKLDNKYCNLLFVGVDWKRKGGEIVLETLDILTEIGFKATLTVCGCTPPESRPNMTVYPFLNKEKETDLKIFLQLFENAHIFFFPTRAECSGIVICEAAAFGIPIISTDTGGVASYIKNNETGYLLPLDAKSEDYAKLIMTLFSDKKLYSEMANQSRILYHSELNWQVWAKEIFEIIQSSKKID
ncbi:MAG: glycosyltransferase family 4 protein [Mariniphaga sp.]